MKTQLISRVMVAVVTATMLLFLNLTLASGQTSLSTLLFDDFTGTTLDTTQWFFGTNSWGSGYGVGNGTLNIFGGYQPGGGGWVLSQQLFTLSQETQTFETRTRVSSADGGHWGFWGDGHEGSLLFGTFCDVDPRCGMPRGFMVFVRAGASGPLDPNNMIPLTDVNVTEWHTYRIEFNSLEAKFYIDGVLRATVAQGLPVGKPMRVRLDRVSWGTNQFLDVDYVRVTKGLPTLVVNIDIKPNDYPNSINPRSNGVIPVAILTTDNFDATTVDMQTIRFGATGTEAVAAKSALEDVNKDSHIDLILHFDTQAIGINCGGTSGVLTGKTLSGQQIKGTDSINTVGCR
ncbi:MAG: glycoside hydrolase family 16 protein [Chloroflexi bacterium]|nr:glycoside hydrolase family 16 protein [Chloroflexota bacterium]